MSQYEYVGDTPALFADIVLGDGVSVLRADADHEETQADGQSPLLYPHDLLNLPDDHEIASALLVAVEAPPTPSSSKPADVVPDPAPLGTDEPKETAE